MPYLRYYDYLKTIQDVQIQQITTSDDNLRILCEQTAQATAIERLAVKYDTAKEFTDTTVYSYTSAYTANSLVELNFTAYDQTAVYQVNALVNYLSACYVCTSVTTAGNFDPNKWQLLGKQYDLFYVTLPYAEFYYRSVYRVGDKVFYKNKVYTCAIATTIIDQANALQFGKTDNVPAPNVFPDDVIYGVQYWGSGISYSVSAGVLPTDATKWTKGDNRNANMVRRLVQICVYYLHDRIAPRNIPELRTNGYQDAMQWLEAASQGEITVDIPLAQPKVDGRIRWGSDVKNINSY